MTNKRKGAKKKESLPPEKTSKQLKREENYARVILQLLAGKAYKPLMFGELASKLSIIPDHFHELQSVLDSLVHEKTISLTIERYSKTVDPSAPSEPGTVKGTIRMNPRGFGFVEVEGLTDLQGDVFIPRHLTQNAMDGDKVEILVASIISEKGPEGRVTKITARSKSTLVGIILGFSSQYANVHVPMLGKEQPVLLEIPHDKKLEIGDRIVMDIAEWGKEREQTICTLSHVIGHISDPSCDIPAAILEYGIRTEFSAAAIEEATKFGTTVPQSAIKEREDLRELETFTIDPDTAKDFDDAISLSKDDKGNYHLAVHIADVASYVQINSELDKEAFLRANSTYFPGKCIPMIPSVLSDNLCSLKPNVNRLTVTVFMDFDSSGEITNYRIGRTVIKSAKRFTYKEAKKVLDGSLKSKHKPTMLLMNELCLLLKKKRYERGSVEFAMPELVILVDEKGAPSGTDYIEYDITHQLVEEFMLKANETVAKHLDSNGKGVPFRVHDEPSEENMRDFSFLANAFGFNLPPKPTPADIQKMFDEALQTPFGQYLATSYIRRMRLAIYSPVNIGHFGLSLTHYCHFTSPIRRYVDLVAHRLIFDYAADPMTLEKISNQCSDRERISAKSEGSVVVLKKYRLLEMYNKEDDQRQYQAIITKIKPFGITFEVMEIMLEGFIHVSEIGTDYYEYDEGKSQLYGKRGGEMYTSGDKITVMVKKLDLITLESEWYMVPDVSDEAPKRKPKFIKERDFKPRSKDKHRKGSKRK